MDSRGRTKKLGDWETWHVCDVRVAVNVADDHDSLRDMVACYVCSSTFQAAKEVKCCRSNQATHENGKYHKAAIRALQIKQIPSLSQMATQARPKPTQTTQSETTQASQTTQITQITQIRLPRSQPAPHPYVFE